MIAPPAGISGISPQPTPAVQFVFRMMTEAFGTVHLRAGWLVRLVHAARGNNYELGSQPGRSSRLYFLPAGAHNSSCTSLSYFLRRMFLPNCILSWRRASPSLKELFLLHPAVRSNGVCARHFLPSLEFEGADCLTRWMGTQLGRGDQQPA